MPQTPALHERKVNAHEQIVPTTDDSAEYGIIQKASVITTGAFIFIHVFVFINISRQAHGPSIFKARFVALCISNVDICVVLSKMLSHRLHTLLWKENISEHQKDKL